MAEDDRRPPASESAYSSHSEALCSRVGLLHAIARLREGCNWTTFRDESSNFLPSKELGKRHRLAHRFVRDPEVLSLLTVGHAVHTLPLHQGPEEK